MARQKTYTLILAPDQDSPATRYRIPRRLLFQAGGAAMFACGLVVAGAVQYLQVAKDAAENRILREENFSLRGQLKAVQQRVEQIGTTLERVERFDQKLRAITLLSDAERGLASNSAAPAPVTRPKGTEQLTHATSGTGGSSAAGTHLDRLSLAAGRQEQSLLELTEYFQDQKSLLASTPSIWPARGWVTSDFGQRLDPYTADRMMHAGMDIAAEPGKPIHAPSNGTVVYAGPEGNYGNVIVLDHGYGIKTRYGHLADMLVRPGDRIKRGEQLGSVGNTGRSTGPHLHYEVRINGIPQNPRTFLLEE